MPIDAGILCLSLGTPIAKASRTSVFTGAADLIGERMPGSVRTRERGQPAVPARTAGLLHISPGRWELSVSLPDRRPAERRLVAPRRQLRQRIEREYEEMPGLCLTIAQAHPLFGLEMDVCVRVLRELVQAEVLRLTPDGVFIRYAGLP